MKPIQNHQEFHRKSKQLADLVLLSKDVKKFIELKSQLNDWVQRFAVEEDENTVPSFDKIIETRMDQTRHLLLVKGKEYIRGNDRFHNFNRTAEMNRETPTRALHGMLSKHLVSYLDMLDDIDKGKIPTEHLINEKFGDIVVYFMIQEALVKDLLVPQIGK